VSTVTIAGEGLEHVLSVDGYEFGAARCELFWRVHELVAFEEQLRAALAARKSRRGAVAELTTLEDQIALQIQVRFGEAQISAGSTTRS
jgi:hypothetical protein